MKMKQNIDPNDIHSAIATWSGFIYQGKIALLHTLRTINSGSYNVINCLQLDSIEDFAIVDNETDLNPLTIHQVKAVKSSQYSDYKEAFIKLEERLLQFPCNGAFFHLAMENKKTPSDIKNLHPKMSIYEYDAGQTYCSLENVNTWIEIQITLYLNSFSLGHHSGSESIIRNHLEAQIFNQVISIHANNHERNGLSISEGAYYYVIPFSSFISVLNSNPTSLLGLEYYLFNTKELLNNYYTEFCLEQDELANGNVSNDIKTKLDIYLQQINGLDNSQLLDFIRKLIPDRQFKLDTLKDFLENNIPKDGFKDAFMQCLYDLRVSDSKIEKGFTWIGNDAKRYIATAIVSNQSNINKICLRIYKNILETDFETPYECDVLITSGLENNSMLETLNNQFNVSEIDNIEEFKKNNITKWSTVSFVKIETAKNNLND